jgi:hypothetical protein
MAESIVALRLTRNLRYKLTYVKVFETYLESATGPDIVELYRLLIQGQRAAIAALAGYLRRLDVSAQELELNDRLLEQAAERTDAKAQLRFVYDGMERAVAWYRMQLVDKQMGGDPDLRRLLMELGELEAAKLWRIEAVMGILRIPTRAKEKELDAEPVPDPTRQENWKPRLVDDFSRPSWGPEQASRWPSPSRPRRKDR